jgi:hypothetical protein
MQRICLKQIMFYNLYSFAAILHLQLMLVRMFFFFFFSFGVLQLMLPEAPQPYGLLYYPRIGRSKFLNQFRATTTPKQRKLEL